MPSRRRRAARTARRSWTVALPLALTACVTQITDPADEPAAPIELSPVIVPLGAATPGASPVHQYYADVLSQMQEAHQERDLGRLRALLATHDRADAPAAIRERMRHVRGAALGLELEAHAASHTSVVGGEGTVPLGAPVQYRVVSELPPGREVAGDRRSAALSYLVRVSLVDHDAYGSVDERTSSMILEAVDADGRRFDLPFGSDVPAGNAVMRECKVSVDLLPGTVRIDGRQASVRRTALCQHTFVQYPEGVDPIRDQPLRTLQRAIELGDAKHYAHQFLAAHFMPKSDREAAMESLIRVVRLGSGEQARVAMACLRTLSGEDLGLGNRDDWLAWWQGRGGRRD